MDKEGRLQVFEKSDALLRNTHVVLTKKEFPKGSGEMHWFHSDQYVNKDALFTRPHELKILCREIADHYTDRGIEVVAAPAVGAVGLSLLVGAMLLPDGCGARVVPVYAEKGEGGEFIFRGYFASLIPGKRVLIVEDVASSGGSAKRVVEAVRKLGGLADDVAFLWNRGRVTPADLGVKEVFSLLESEMPMFLAEVDGQCPLCRDRIPIDKRVGKWREYLEEKAAGADAFAEWCRSQL